jgi:lipopolysaccharide transport system ATP-binding protein
LVGHGNSGISDLLDTVATQAVTCANLSALSLPARYAWLHQAEDGRRQGQVVFCASTDPELLRTLADEVWWLESGRLVRRGDPGGVIEAYTRSVIQESRLSFPPSQLHPTLRRGDGRARIRSVKCLDALDQPVAVVESGQPAAIQVEVEFLAPVADPVVGILIRTRIGLEVYGTNTELERLAFGPVQAGDVKTLTFRFACQLCPQSYTVTAASHDPDGVWHEWMEDAISFTVTDTRYTAGVANLRAKVELS